MIVEVGQRDAAMSPTNGIITIVNLVLMGMAIIFIASQGLGGPPAGWKYIDLVTILLGVAAVVLAAVGFGVAILSLWGYHRIIASANEAAVAATKVEATRYLGGPEFQESVRAAVDKLYKQEAASRVQTDDVVEQRERRSDSAETATFEPLPEPDRGGGKGA